MKQPFLLILTLIFGFSNFMLAQIQPLWSTNYSLNYPNTISQNSMLTDKNGDVYIVGHTNDTSYANVKCVTLKYKSNGQLLWIQYFDSIKYYTRIAIDDSSNIYVAGSYDNGLKTFKYNSVGSLMWSSTYPSTGYGIWSWDIITDNNSNVFVTGHSTGNRFTTLKYNTNGNLIWAALDTIAVGQGPSHIALDDSNNVYVAIRTFDTSDTTMTSSTIKYNSSGTKIWHQINSGNFTQGSAAPVGIKYHPSGFIYVLAVTNNNNNGKGDYNIVKYDTSGNLIWTYSYSFTEYYDIPIDFVLDKSGNAYITGVIYPTGGMDDSLATIKVNKLGTFEWKRTYSSGYSQIDEASAITIDTLGYIYVAGKSSDNFNDRNFITIKYDSIGNQVWIARYKHTMSSWDTPNSICLDKSGNIYLSGNSMDFNSTGILTVKYSKTVGISELSTENENAVYIYPNPFHSFIVLNSNIDLIAADLFIYDQLGKVVLTVQNINQKSTVIQRNNLTNGLYFFRLIEKDKLIAKGKIIAD